jgi:transposase
MVKKIRLTTEQITQLKQKGISQKDMANIFQVSPQTIIRWKSGSQRKKRKPKDYGNIPELLKSYIFKFNTATQQEIANLIFKETGQPISQQKVSFLLKILGITRKKLTWHYNQLDEEKAKAFNEGIKPLLNEHPFIALDECSFYPNDKILSKVWKSDELLRNVLNVL